MVEPMLTEQRAVAALRALIILLLAVLIVLQVLSLPGQFAHMAEQNSRAASLRWPLTAVTVFWVGCVQAVLVATWRLLTLVTEDRIFSDDSRHWVDVIVGAVGAAWVVLVGVFLAVGLTADDPGAPFLLFLLVVGVAVVGLLMVVMRALLRRATTLRAEMEAVI